MLYTLAKFIRKESKPIMIMFYAPWCGFCKSMKPEYAEAANDLQGHAVLAAIDVNRPENAVIRSQYNITGFPTLLYYEHGVLKYTYEGENTRAAIVAFMQNPAEAPVKIKEPEWSDVDSEVVHLTSTSFEPVLKEEASVLIMFYAPWCGHCKKMKPEYEKAAAELKSNNIPGMLAAVDATKEQSLASKFNIKGYPTVKYFSFGEEKFDVNVRDTDKIVQFMNDPREPPKAVPVANERHWADEKTHVVHLDSETFKPFLKKKKHVLVMFYAPWCGFCKKAKPEFTKAAERFKDDSRIEFAAVDCTTQRDLCSSNDIKGFPTIKYYSYYKTVKEYTGGRQESDFVTFMLNPDASEQKKVDSWHIEKGKVIHVNDRSFSTVVNTREPTLVMFYAPWCGHCKKLKPEYSAAAEALSQEGATCKMAMFDCTENPQMTEKFSISGFPTMKLFINGKYVEDYKGKRTSADLKEYMKQWTKIKRREEL